MGVFKGVFGKSQVPDAEGWFGMSWAFLCVPGRRVLSLTDRSRG